MRAAKRSGAGVVHFSETALSGYAGVDFDSLDGFDWDLLVRCTRELMALAADLRLWVILGSTHRLNGRRKPLNCLYIINDRGRIVERYDKMFCTGDRAGSFGDLKHYSPGNHFTVFTIGGIRCGALICHDCRYDELYREYKRRGVQLMFHSYHNARRPRVKMRKGNNLGMIVPPTMQAYAANNYMCISANNSSQPISCWPSFFVRPDGMIIGRLRNNRSGVLISTVQTDKKFKDASAVWRDRALRGIYHSGRVVRDGRVDCRTSL